MSLPSVATIMQPQTNRRLRRWTVDLALGRRWWVLPFVGIVPLAACIAWMRFSTSPFSSRVSILEVIAPEMAVMWAIGATSTIAAVLNLRGARLRHRIASVVTIALAALLLGSNGGLANSAIILAGLSLSQLTAMRLINLPRWRIRPATRRSRGVSIAFLLAITAAAAAVAAGVAQIVQPPGHALWVLWLQLVTGCLLGQIVSAVAARQWAQLGCGVVGGVVIAMVALVAIGHFELVLTRPWGVVIKAAPAYIAGWMIGYFHRCDRKRSAVAGVPSAVS